MFNFRLYHLNKFLFLNYKINSLPSFFKCKLNDCLRIRRFKVNHNLATVPNKNFAIPNNIFTLKIYKITLRTLVARRRRRGRRGRIWCWKRTTKFVIIDTTKLTSVHFQRSHFEKNHKNSAPWKYTKKDVREMGKAFG